MAKLVGAEHLPLQDELRKLLDKADPVDQQIAIELLTVGHAMRMGEHADFVADSMHKHVRQLLEQWRSRK